MSTAYANVLLLYILDMFCELGFVEHMCDDAEDELDDVHLPKAIPPNLKTNRKGKTMFYELEVCLCILCCCYKPYTHYTCRRMICFSGRMKEFRKILRQKVT